MMLYLQCDLFSNRKKPG